MPTLAEFQFPPVLAAAVAGMVLGALWYSPLLFGNAWMRALGKTTGDLGPAGPAMAGSMAACLVTAVVVEFFVVATGAYTPAAGAGVGALLGVGILATGMLSDSLFSGWGWRLYFIQAGYRVCYLVVMGALCGGWPR